MTVAPERLIIRDSITSKCNIYDNWQSLTQESKDTITRRIERSCFEVVIETCIKDGINRLFTDKRFVERYSLVCCKVLSCIDDVLISKILNNDINPYDVARLPLEELCPESGKEERRQIELRRNQKVENKFSTMYTCFKCKENKTVKIEYQGRAADELSSHSIKCINCEHVWRL